MSRPGQPHGHPHGVFVRSGHALPEPYDRPQYPSSPANGSYPSSHAEHLYQLHQAQHRAMQSQSSHLQQQPSHLQSQGQGETQQSYSYRSDVSYDTQGTERERQRLVQEWAFDTQPPELPAGMGRPESRDGESRRESQVQHTAFGPAYGRAAYSALQHPMAHLVDRSQSPMNHSQRNGSPNRQYDRRMHSPATAYYPTPHGTNRHEGPSRVGSAMAIDNLVRDGRDHQAFGRVAHHSPLNEQMGRMESPEHVRSSRPREEYADRAERHIMVDQHRPAGQQFQPVPLTNIGNAEVLASMRYAHHQSHITHPHTQHQMQHQSQQPRHQPQHQHPQLHTTAGPDRTVAPSPLGHLSLQRPSARSSVVPGTPSERYDESYTEDQEAQGSTPIRSHTAHDRPGRPGGRIIAMASSPPLERGKAVRERVGVQRGETPLEESLLEPTQRNEDVVVSSPVGVREEPVRSPVKTPGKGRKVGHQGPVEQVPARSAFISKSAQETDEDTFIRAEDRKVAFKKRSNAEMDECMHGVLAPPVDGTSPNKRKKGKAGALEEAMEGRKVQGRGELAGRKGGNLVLLGKAGAGTSPVKKQKTVNAPPEKDPEPTILHRLFLPAADSETSMGNTTAEIIANLPTHRRLQKTSAAGSSAPLAEAVSLQGIDSYERRGEGGMMDDEPLEETQAPPKEKLQDDKWSLNESLLMFGGIEKLASPEMEGPVVRSDKAPSQSRSTSLTPAPESEDEPRLETLVVPSPVRHKTYKSPAKKRRVRQVSAVRDASSSRASDSEADTPKRRKAPKKQGRPKKKIASPTVSPTPSANGKDHRKPANGSVTSLSDAPVGERWDDMPPPVMKDDPRDRDFRPAAHSQMLSSPTRKISTRRESTTSRPLLRAKRIFGRWRGDFYTGDLIGKENHKYVLVFDDKETARVDLDDLRQCIFHIGDEIRTTVSLKPKIHDGTLVVVGTVDPDLDMSQPLMSNEMLLVRGKSGKTHEIAVQYCSFAEDNEDALDDRQFGESELDELCALSDSNTPAPKKPTRNGRTKPAITNSVARIPNLRRQHRSDSRSDRTRPLYNFAFVITSNPNVADKSAQTKDLKAKIVDAGGRVMEDFFELYPKPRADRISADEITLGKHHHKLHGIFLLVLNPMDPKSPCLTEKVMMALALGVPCLSATYIEELLKEEETTSWRCFLLSAGLSLQLKSEVSQIVNLNYGEGPEHLVKKIDGEGVVRRPFVNRSFFIAAGVNYIIPYVCAAMGAENVTLARGRKATSATPELSGRSTTDFDYIIVADDAPKPKGKKEIARTCNVEWVKQCLIMGKLYQPSIMVKPDHWNEKKEKPE